MTRQQAALVLAKYVAREIINGDLWDDPDFAEEVNALKALGITRETAERF